MKILVVKPSSLGDVIHALPFLKAVKDTFPEAHVDWVISISLAPLLEGHPLIHDLIPLNKDVWRDITRLPSTASEIAALYRRIRAHRYDSVVDLQGLLRSGLITGAARAGRKIGFDDAREGSRLFYDTRIPVNSQMHAVDKYLKAAEALGARPETAEFLLPVDDSAAVRVRDLLGTVDQYIVIVPSARWASKRWPPNRFVQLISMVSLPCVLTGSEGDAAIAKMITDAVRQFPDPQHDAGASGMINLCGKTDIRELIALIAEARAVVSNDSGPLHIAAALDRPTVAIFGPTDPVKTGPYGWQKKSNLKVVRAGAGCSPCREKDCREHTCMERISPVHVYEALKALLKDQR